MCVCACVYRYICMCVCVRMYVHWNLFVLSLYCDKTRVCIEGKLESPNIWDPSLISSLGEFI